MATITITIPDEFVQRVLDGLVPVVPEGLTQGQAAKEVIINLIKTTVRTQEKKLARVTTDAAIAAAQAEAAANADAVADVEGMS